MELIKDNIGELMVKAEYHWIQEYTNERLNRLINYWWFLDNEEMTIQKLTNASLETILYSKYYWASRFMDEFKKADRETLYIKPELLRLDEEQQHFKILDEMEYRLTNGPDWNYVEKLYHGKV